MNGALDADQVRNLIDYDQITGYFFWKPRHADMFEDGGHSARHNCAAWNARYAGTIAGTPDTRGYLAIRIFGRLYLSHRLAWLIVTGEWPVAEIDHINCNPSDNRFANLRQSTPSQNGANRRLRINSSSGFKGVSWISRDRKWQAKIGIMGKTLNLGYFDSAEDAAAAYQAAAREYFGSFARVA